ncbi:hypothetical protein E8E13_010706 [Curvularia kusanoi]|uniref:Uncharacterized protein n=1 Tax=Curvularia kusanoi TaxID=90978 RepID=A0A9P4TK04_CURKU|nr:hypothetical protein E8E13_010706 [Curvularia kusanoi]
MAFAFAACGIDRPRYRRERRYCNAHAPPSYYDGYGCGGCDREYEDIRYDHISVSRRRGRQHDCRNNDWCFCRGDYREPYEFLSHYGPLAGLMDEVHECCIALTAGRFIAQEMADKFEEASRAINAM